MKNKLSNLILSLLLLIIALALFSLLLELELRVFYPQDLSFFQPDSALGYKGKPNLITTISVSDEFKNTISLNSKGFRSGEITYPKKEGVYRILVLGDSFALGVGVEQNETFSAILESSLNKRDINRTYEVINTGLSGYSTDQQLAFFTEEGNKYKPDKVILAFVLLNDVVDNLKDNIYKLDNKTLMKTYPSHEFGKIFRTRAFLATRSHFYKFISNAYRSFEKKAAREKTEKYFELFLKNPPSSIDEGWNKTFALIKQLNKEVKNVNSSLLILIIPAKEQVSKDALNKILTELNRSSDEFDTSAPTEKLLLFLEKNKISYIDTSQLFKDKINLSEHYYIKDTHWTFKSHALAANQISERLINN